MASTKSGLSWPGYQGQRRLGETPCGQARAETRSGMHARVLQGMGAWILGHSAPGHSAVWPKVKAPTPSWLRHNIQERPISNSYEFEHIEAETR